MSVYWVNYDLNRPGQEYGDLIAYLKSHRGWAKPAKSSFFVDTDLTGEQLLKGILGHVDAGDRVALVEVTDQYWATFGMPDDVNDWLRSCVAP